jgi:putative thiazole/oxazole-modified microcin (TOMM)-like peptide
MNKGRDSADYLRCRPDVSLFLRGADGPLTSGTGGEMADSIYVLGDEDRKKFAKLIAQAWSDESVKDRYENEPRAVLGEFGITYPDGLDTPAMPGKPVGEFSVEDLEMAAGSCLGSASSVSTVGGTAFTAACLGSGLS